jgi:hypothetical protein
MFSAYRSGSACVPLDMQRDPIVLGIIQSSGTPTIIYTGLRRGKQSSPARMMCVTLQCEFKLVNR